MTTPPCAANPERWFSTDRMDIKAAQSICATCPIREACEALAREVRPTAGVWAGRNRNRVEGIQTRTKWIDGQPPTIACADCGGLCINNGFGMCATCYKREWRKRRADGPTGGPRNRSAA